MKAKTNQNTILTDQSFFTLKINTVQTQACHLGQKARDFPPATAKVTPSYFHKNQIQQNLCNPNSERKQKTVRVFRVDCKIYSAMLNIGSHQFSSTSVYGAVQTNFHQNGNVMRYFL